MLHSSSSAAQKETISARKANEVFLANEHFRAPLTVRQRRSYGRTVQTDMELATAALRRAHKAFRSLKKDSFEPVSLHIVHAEGMKRDLAECRKAMKRLEKKIEAEGEGHGDAPLYSELTAVLRDFRRCERALYRQLKTRAPELFPTKQKITQQEPSGSNTSINFVPAQVELSQNEVELQELPKHHLGDRSSVAKTEPVTPAQELPSQEIVCAPLEPEALPLPTIEICCSVEARSRELSNSRINKISRFAQSSLSAVKHGISSLLTPLVSKLSLGSLVLTLFANEIAPEIQNSETSLPFHPNTSNKNNAETKKLEQVTTPIQISTPPGFTLDIFDVLTPLECSPLIASESVKSDTNTANSSLETMPSVTAELPPEVSSMLIPTNITPVTESTLIQSNKKVITSSKQRRISRGLSLKDLPESRLSNSIAITVPTIPNANTDPSNAPPSLNAATLSTIAVTEVGLFDDEMQSDSDAKAHKDLISKPKYSLESTLAIGSEEFRQATLFGKLEQFSFSAGHFSFQEEELSFANFSVLPRKSSQTGIEARVGGRRIVEENNETIQPTLSLDASSIFSNNQTTLASGLSLNNETFLERLARGAPGGSENNVPSLGVDEWLNFSFPLKNHSALYQEFRLEQEARLNFDSGVESFMAKAEFASNYPLIGVPTTPKDLFVAGKVGALSEYEDKSWNHKAFVEVGLEGRYKKLMYEIAAQATLDQEGKLDSGLKASLQYFPTRQDIIKLEAYGGRAEIEKKTYLDRSEDSFGAMISFTHRF